MPNTSTWDIQLKSQQQTPKNPAYNLQGILDRKAEGTDYNAAPTYDINAAVGRRLNTINQMGDQQNAFSQDQAQAKQQTAQATQLATAQRAYQTAQGSTGYTATNDYKAPTGGSGPQIPGDTRGNIIKLASTLTATPYVWGGTTTKGFDCSGLVQYVYNKMGIKLPRVSQQQATVGTRTTIDKLKPGDLVAWGSSPSTSTHIAIYAGNGQIWEAARKGTNVRTRAINSNERGIMGISFKI